LTLYFRFRHRNLHTVSFSLIHATYLADHFPLDLIILIGYGAVYTSWRSPIMPTRYGVDGPGIESRRRRDIPQLSRPALGPTKPPVQWVSGIFPGVKRSEGGVHYPTSSGAEVKENVEPYLYSPSGASWSFIGRTLPFTSLCTFFQFPGNSSLLGPYTFLSTVFPNSLTLCSSLIERE